MSKMIRKEVNGLRALAVISVILFHADFTFFSGGYIGVDVFFVISGYLITQLIIKEIKIGTFSLLKFYERRARRLLPALFFVILVSIFISLLFMPSFNYQNFSKSIISVVFFISNIFFYKQSGYFSENSNETPLLHTWSLSVEEQFYIFFPLLLLALKFTRQKIIIILIIIIIIISFSLAQFGGNLNFTYPFLEDEFHFTYVPAWAFYSTPTRIWELLIGSLIAFYLTKNNNGNGFKFISALGLSLITYSVVFYNDSIPYPSIFTLIPVLGTVLFIVGVRENDISHKILASKYLSGIGLISYSAYLWHQPLFAFVSMNSIEKVPSHISIFLILLTFFMAYFSWKYIEKPFRDYDTQKNSFKISSRKLFIILITSILIIFIYFLTINSNFYKSKSKLPIKTIESFNIDERHQSCFDQKIINFNDKNCTIGTGSPISFFIVGDSHARIFANLFDIISTKNNQRGIYMAYSGCVPFLNIYSLKPDQKILNCNEFNENIFQYVKQKKIKKIFLIARWDYYTHGGYDRQSFSYIGINKSDKKNPETSKIAFKKGFISTVEKYGEIGVEVIIIKQIPFQKYEPKEIFYKFYDEGISKDIVEKYSISTHDFNKINIFATNLFEKIKFNNLSIIDFNKTLCKKGLCPISGENLSYYHDKNHLSNEGTLLLKKDLNNFFKENF